MKVSNFDTITDAWSSRVRDSFDGVQQAKLFLFAVVYEKGNRKIGLSERNGTFYASCLVSTGIQHVIELSTC